MTQTKAELLQTRHQGDIRLGDADSTHYVGFKAPATVTSSLVWTLPAADGTAGYYLKTDGSGNLDWSLDNSGVSLSGSTNNTIATVTGANALQGEANLTFDGNYLTQNTDADQEGILIRSTGNTYNTITLDANRGTADYSLGDLRGKWNGTEVNRIRLHAGDDTTNKDDGEISFWTKISGGTNTERMRIDSSGRLLLGTTTLGPSDQYNNNFIIYEDGNTGLSIRGKDNNSNYATLSLGDTTAASRGYLEAQLGTNGNFTIGSTGTGAMRFLNNGTEKMRLDSNGRLLIGQTSADTDLGGALQIAGNSYAASGTLQARLSADQYGPAIDLLKSRNTTWGTHTIVQDDDQLGRIYFRGDDGTDYGSGGAAIIGSVDGTPGSDDMPSRLTFHTSADGSVSLTERMRITNAGKIGIGTTSGTAKLEISDTVGSTGEEVLLKLAGRSTKNVYLDINADADRRGVIRFQSAGTDKWSIGRGDSDELSDSSFHISTGASGGNTAKLTLTSTGNATFAGTVSDNIGELRQIPARSVSSVTLATSDVGKAILATSTVTVPNSTFSAGDAVTIINNSGSDITISKSISTMYLASDGSSTNRTLATRGMATIWFASGTVAYISGAGLS